MSNDSPSDLLLDRRGMLPEWHAEELAAVERKLNALYEELGHRFDDDIDDDAEKQAELDDKSREAMEKTAPYRAYAAWLKRMADFMTESSEEDYQRRYRRYVRPILDAAIKLASEQTGGLFGRGKVKNEVDKLASDRVSIHSEGYRSKENYKEADCQSVMITAFEEDVFWMVASAFGAKTDRATPMKKIFRLLGAMDVTLQYLPNHGEASKAHRYFSRTPDKKDKSVLRKTRKGLFKR